MGSRLDMVGVAQLVERWIVAPVAEGSNPFAHPFRETTSSGVPGTPGPEGPAAVW